MNFLSRGLMAVHNNLKRKMDLFFNVIMIIIYFLEAKASTPEFPSTTKLTQSSLTSTNSTTSHSYSTPSTTNSSLISPNISSTSISHLDASPTFPSSSSSFPTSPYTTSSFHSSSSPTTTISKTSEFSETTNTFTHTTTTPTMTTSAAKNTISSSITYITGSSSLPSTMSTTSESTDNTTSTHPTKNSSPKSSTINTASSVSTENYTTSTKHSSTETSTNVSSLSASTEESTTSTHLTTDISTETSTTDLSLSTSTEKSTTSTELITDVSTETSAVDSSTSVSTEKSTTSTSQTTDISKDYSTVTTIASASTVTSTATSEPTSTVTTESTTTSITSPVSTEKSTTSTHPTTTTTIASSTVSTTSPVSIETSPTSTNPTTTTTIASSTVSTSLPVSTETSTTPTHPTTTTTTESSTMSTTSQELTTESPSTVSATEGSTTTTTLPNISTSTPMSTTSKLENCGNPPEIDFGQIEKNGTSPGSVATYYCRPGYNISGNNSVVCETNGNWTALETKCLPVDCGNLYLPINNSEEIKYIQKTSTIYGSVALIQCKYGFSLSKENKSVTFICSENGYWTGNTSVKCTPVSCRPPEVPANAALSHSNSSFSVGSVVRYYCNKGYLLEGRSTRACQSSGNWSESVPSCKQAPQTPISPCEATRDSRGLFWNKTNPGQIIMIQCSVYDPKQDVSGEITRKCSTEGKWLLPHYNCIRKELEEITKAVDIIKDKPTEKVVSDVLGRLSIFTDKKDSNRTYSGELEAVTTTLKVIASIDYSDINLPRNQTEFFFATTSNLLDTSNAESWQAIDDQPSSSSAGPSGASKVLDVISSYTDAVSNMLNSTGENSPVSFEFDNLLLEIRSLQDSVDIVFPHTDQNSSSSLDLPKASLNGSATYSAVLYKILSGLMSINASFHGDDMELGSSVLSVKLDNWEKVDNFKITFSFQHLEADKDLTATCSYRNESGVLWGRDGCTVKHTNTTVTICECEHLTNFAILMSPWTEDNVETEAIRIVSIVGCSISMLCLVITILTHMCYWKYVKSDRVKILMNLCLALLISYCIFLGGVDRTSNKDVCTTVAVFLQYIYLVVFFLMLAEGVEISFVVLYVFTTKSRLKWILPSAWLLPALIVGISLAVTQTKGYGNDKSCWLSVDDGLIWAFVGPALLIILINFILIVLVLKAVFRTKNLSQKSLRERTIVGVRCLCVLLPLVGCTWVLGIFYVNEDMAWIQYVFAVCNGLQGFAIFLFHCALNTQIKHAFDRRRKSLSAATFTRSTSNPILIPRAKPSSTTSDLYQSINNSFGAETTFHRNRNVRERYQAVETLEMKRFPDTGYRYDEW